MSAKVISQAQREEFERLVDERVKAITAALPGHQPTFVVLEALLRVHRLGVSRLDRDAKGYVAMALGEYAGELLRASSRAPTDQPIH